MRLTVNGEVREAGCEPADSLLPVLRDQLGLTAAKLACGRGECGACTVLIDGRPRMSCITLVGALSPGGEVVTLEGLADESADLRAEFADRGAFQCGFCTPGHVVHATALLRRGLPADPEQRRAQVRHALNGNVCRCTGYQAIVDAICATADRRAEAGTESTVLGSTAPAPESTAIAPGSTGTAPEGAEPAQVRR